MTIRTFSGAHPYQPQCVVSAAREVFEKVLGPDWRTDVPDLPVRVAQVITTDISNGRCPRCHDPLHPDVKPDGWKPAGSRALPCRCLPICETCASWIEPIIGTNPVTAWPTTTDLDDDGDETRKEHEHKRVRELKERAGIAVLAVPAIGRGGLVLIVGDGVTPVQPRPNPGGWLEHGYDDTADQRERQS